MIRIRYAYSVFEDLCFVALKCYVVQFPTASHTMVLTPWPYVRQQRQNYVISGMNLRVKY